MYVYCVAPDAALAGSCSGVPYYTYYRYPTQVYAILSISARLFIAQLHFSPLGAGYTPNCQGHVLRDELHLAMFDPAP